MIAHHQPVWLEPLPAICIDQVRWTPSVERMALSLSLSVRGAVGRPLSLRIELSLAGRSLVDDRCSIRAGEALRREFTLAERANVGRAKVRAAIRLAERLGIIAVGVAPDRKRMIINQCVTSRC